TNNPDGPCNSASDIVVVTANTCAAGYCTYTQGAYGNLGGKDSYKNAQGACVKSVDAKGTIKAALEGWGAGGMNLANMNFMSTSASDIQLILDYLPNGGPSKTYTGTKANLLVGGDKNTLLAQTMTLGLNIGLNSSLKSFTLENKYLVTGSSDDCGETPDGLTTQCFKFSVSSAMNVNGIAGVQVEDIWILGNRALKGEALPAGVTLSAIAGAADMVNNAFDECRVPLRWSETDACSGAANTLANMNTETFGSSVNSSSALGKELTVKAYPNPFKDRVFFRFTSPVSGKATVEIFDMTGRRLEVINKGQVVAGRENTVEYTVPSSNRNSIIYRVSVDKFSVNGRLVSPGINR
ncbi:MAG TPA: T9SS type A sorting domain-containing protein, partial [Chitinophagaceae bacterium]|nr:T9SS type A sorting domain-containing protein [Chitinophagaceae bacterium]